MKFKEDWQSSHWKERTTWMAIVLLQFIVGILGVISASQISSDNSIALIGALMAMVIVIGLAYVPWRKKTNSRN